MKLYFLRHGEADWPNWDRPDDERPLTERGKKEMRKVAKFLRALDIPIEEIISSPLPRARQTADIIGERFKMHVREQEALAHGFDVSGLKDIVRKYRLIT
jgi:phosphohistidine phosphatase